MDIYNLDYNPIFYTLAYNPIYLVHIIPALAIGSSFN